MAVRPPAVLGPVAVRPRVLGPVVPGLTGSPPAVTWREHRRPPPSAWRLAGFPIRLPAVWLPALLLPPGLPELLPGLRVGPGPAASPVPPGPPCGCAWGPCSHGCAWGPLLPGLRPGDLVPWLRLWALAPRAAPPRPVARRPRRPVAAKSSAPGCRRGRVWRPWPGSAGPVPVPRPAARPAGMTPLWSAVPARPGRACGRGRPGGRVRTVGWASCSQACGSTAGHDAAVVAGLAPWPSCRPRPGSRLGVLLPRPAGSTAGLDAAVVACRWPGAVPVGRRPGSLLVVLFPGLRESRRLEKLTPKRCCRHCRRVPSRSAGAVPVAGSARSAGVVRCCARQHAEAAGLGCPLRPPAWAGPQECCAAGIAGMVRVLVTYAATWRPELRADSLMAPARSSSASRAAASRIASACSAACARYAPRPPGRRRAACGRPGKPPAA